MATSGTLGATRISTAKLLDKAIRRCGKTPAELSPEIIESAQEDLYMFLTSLAVRGLNLWCIDHKLLAITVNQSKYVLPVGTQDVLNVYQSTHTFVTGTTTATATYTAIALSASNTVVRYSIKFTSAPTSFQFQKSDDGVSWTTVQTVTDAFAINTLYWFDVDPGATAQYFRILSTGHVASVFSLATVIRDLPLTPFNRDDFTALPNKLQTSETQLNYFFEKLIDPVFSVWPVPTDDTRCLVVWRYRQIQDIGSLTNEIEIPLRWFEAVCWHLALRLSFELPNVDPQRRTELTQMASTQTIEIEKGESDGAPVFLAPSIAVYTR